MSKLILIVEDEAQLAEILSDALKKANLKTIIAKDGEQGLKLALNKSPDLILLDLMLPKKSGIEVLKSLRHQEKGKSIPVIVLTNLTDPATINEALQNGVANFLVKSNWDIDALVIEIKSALR